MPLWMIGYGHNIGYGFPAILSAWGEENWRKHVRRYGEESILFTNLVKTDVGIVGVSVGVSVGASKTSWCIKGVYWI